MYKPYNPILSGKESFHSAHRSRGFHQSNRAEIRFKERRAFRAAMAAVRHLEAPKVVHHKATPDAGQLRILATIRQAAEARAQADAERRIRNAGRPCR
jgi:hypothetical protein